MKRRALWVTLFIVLLIAGFGISYLLGAHNQYRDIAGTWEVQLNNPQQQYIEAVNLQTELGEPTTLTIKGDGSAVFKTNTFGLTTFKVSYELPRERLRSSDSYEMSVKKAEITQSIYANEMTQKLSTLYSENASPAEASEELIRLLDELKADTSHQADIRDEAQEHIYAQNYFDIISENETSFKLTYQFPKKETLYIRVVSKDKLESVDTKTNQVLATFTRKK
ncbi:hypothetical protein [Isobaculum melis]|uniref:Uncharacterized protein n=1 Tax=Isobaculum melis TaxID=142588 RepID=A0A1H9QFM6_9LACT|nr:hypothetical protein [Isobaculum melis]SER59228.1 hypothetical protein SAMN04488559_10245 [Isobaculum melis]